MGYTLGSLVFQRQDMDNLQSIRDVYGDTQQSIDTLLYQWPHLCDYSFSMKTYKKIYIYIKNK